MTSVLAVEAIQALRRVVETEDLAYGRRWLALLALGDHPRNVTELEVRHVMNACCHTRVGFETRDGWLVTRVAVDPDDCVTIGIIVGEMWRYGYSASGPRPYTPDQLAGYMEPVLVPPRQNFDVVTWSPGPVTIRVFGIRMDER